GMAFPASAHVLETDDHVGVGIHIDPEDDPIVAEESKVFLEFKDKNEQFSLQSCHCVVLIYQGDKLIFTQRLVASDQDSPVATSFAYTFPERNVYQIKIMAAPSFENSFDPVSIAYDIRVDRETSAKEPQPDPATQLWQRYWPVGLVILII